MFDPRVLISSLYVLAAVLPIVGLSLAFSDAWRSSRDFERRRGELASQSGRIAIGKDVILTGDVTELMRRGVEAPRVKWMSLGRDLALVGIGLVCGAVASVWSLWL